MGTVISFHGVKIKINANDHVPPHCHVEGRGGKARFDLSSNEWIESVEFSKRDLEKLREQILIYHDALMETWRTYHEE